MGKGPIPGRSKASSIASFAASRSANPLCALPRSLFTLRLSRSKAVAKAETDMLNEEFTAIGRRILRDRGFAKLADSYKNPDKNPDLPFLWRAIEWAKQDNGIIAFALPARIFGRTTGNGYEAWRAVLRSISLTGLINGSDL